MLDPEYLSRITEGAEDIAEQLHQEIVNAIVDRIMTRLGRGDDYILTPGDKWQLEVLEQAGFLREDIQKEIAKRTKLQQKEIKAAFEDAGVRTMKTDAEIYKAAGISPAPLTQSPEIVRMLQTMYERTMGEWINYTKSTADEAQRLFIRECDKAYNLVLSGAESYTGAVKKAVEAIASDGVEVTYPSGHKDTLETATMRAVRTGVVQAASQTTLTRAHEMGVDLVMTSSHLGARPSHEPWQGKVFHVDYDTLSWKFRKRDAPLPVPKTRSDKYPDFVESTRYGYPDGLAGPNCRHSVFPYFEGITNNPFVQYDAEENRKEYEKQQRQRELENRIRKTKREVMAYKEALDKANDDIRPKLEGAYERKSALLERQNKEYAEFNEANGLKPRNERIQIARWDREAAKQARIAANRARKSYLSSGGKEWPPLGDRISPKQYFELSDLAEKNNVRMSYFDGFRGDPEAVKPVITGMGKVMEDFPELKEEKNRPALAYSPYMAGKDYASTKDNGVILNVNAFASKTALKSDYSLLANSDPNYFVFGTEFTAIPYHEMGHYILARYHISPRKVIEEIGIPNVGVISLYAKKDFGETVAELMSAYYSRKGGKQVLQYADKCFTILQRERRRLQ